MTQPAWVIPDYREEEREVEHGGEKKLVRVLVCVECGTVRYSGDWPHCPHGDGTKFGEEPLEPYVDENIAETPVLITSRGQRAKIMSENHLEFRKKRTDLLPSTRKFFVMGKGR